MHRHIVSHWVEADTNLPVRSKAAQLVRDAPEDRGLPQDSEIRLPSS
jgi:hypothetical protein